MRSRLRELAFDLTLVGVSTVAGLLLLEAGVRLFRPQPVAALSRSARLGWIHRPSSSVIYQREEFRVPVRYSSAGLRDREYPFDKPAGTFRIAMLGDSFVEALQVPLDSCAAKRTEAWLNRRARDGRRYELLNFGVSGYGTCQQLLLLDELVLRFQPDLVISQFYANDLDDDRRAGACRLDAGGELEVAPAPRLSWRQRASGSVKSFLFRHSHLFMFVVTRRLRVVDPKPHATEVPVVTPAAPDRTAVPSCPGNHRTLESRLTLREEPMDVQAGLALQGEIWARMAAVARARGAGFLVVLGVSRPAVDPSADAADLETRGCSAAAHDSNLLRDRVRAAAEDRGLPVLDLLPAFQEAAGREPLHYRHDAHWNAAGHRVAAQALCDELARRGILHGVASTR